MGIIDYNTLIADVTQLVEQQFCKLPVVSSILTIGSPGQCNGSTRGFGPLCLGSNPSPGIYQSGGMVNAVDC